MIAPDTHKLARGRIQVSRSTLERLWLLALIGSALFLACVNLPYSPRTWFDEGSHLHVPKTLVQYGVYADISSEGFRYYGPTVGVGPTVMLPVALIFKIFGVGLVQGRLVIVAYLLVALAAFYALGRRLFGRSVALLAVTLLLASRTMGANGIVEFGRQVLGEVPGVAFLLLGALAWLAALQSIADPRQPTLGGRSKLGRSHIMYCLFAGLAFGLALVTKNQFVLIVPPTLLVVALLDWRYYRVGTWKLRLAPMIVACACFGLWTLAQFQFLGPGSFAENMRQTRQAAGGAIFVFDLRAMLRAGYYLLRPDLFGGLLIPSLLYGMWRARKRSAQGLAEALLVVLIGLWLTWFVGASLGWQRYAFPAVVFGALLIARALADLMGWLWSGASTRRALAVLVGGYTVLAIAFPLTLTVRDVLSPDDSAQQFAAYLEAQVPQDTIVETWEPELGLLTNHRYHYPPIALLDIAVRHQWLGGPPLVYNGLSDAPAYVVVGPFGAYTGVYAPDALAREYVEQRHIGSYVLFRRK